MDGTYRDHKSTQSKRSANLYYLRSELTDSRKKLTVADDERSFDLATDPWESVPESDSQSLTMPQHRTEDSLWIHLVEAQRLAPDNVTINWLVYERWPESVVDVWLVDAISEGGKLMDKSMLERHIFELDPSDDVIGISIAERMNNYDSILLRVHELQPIATIRKDGDVELVSNSAIAGYSDINSALWKERQFDKRGLLIMLLQHEPMCAQAYRLLGETLDNPFERISWEYDGALFSFNRSGLYDKAERLC